MTQLTQQTNESTISVRKGLRRQSQAAQQQELSNHAEPTVFGFGLGRAIGLGLSCRLGLPDLLHDSLGKWRARGNREQKQVCDVFSAGGRGNENEQEVDFKSPANWNPLN